MKKLLSVFLAVCIIISVSGSVFASNYSAPTFSDVPEGHWAYTYVKEMVERGVLNGYEDGTFRPDNYIKRAEAAKVIAKIEGRMNVSATIKFDDVDEDAWYAGAVAGASKYFNYDSGYYLVDGKKVQQKRFRPNDYARRDEIIVALMKQRYSRELPTYNKEEINKHYILEETQESNVPYIMVAIEKGIVNGYYHEEYGVSTIVPYANITRAEFATMLYKLYYCVDISDTIPTDSSLTTECSLEQFIQRYNQALRDNYDKIEWNGKEEISVVAMELDIDMLVQKPIEQVVNLKKKAEIYKSLTAFKNDAATFFVDKNNIIKGMIIEYKEVGATMANAFTLKENRNVILLPTYRHICALMAFYNLSYDDALKVLNTIKYNEGGSRIYNGFDVALFKDGISIFANECYIDGSTLGIEAPTIDKTGIDTLGLTIDEFVDSYNLKVHENFKHITADCRYISPYDYIINKNNLLSYRSADGNFISYYFGMNLNDRLSEYIRIVCNNQNEVVAVRVMGGSTSWEADIRTFRILCALSVVTNENIDDVEERYSATKKVGKTTSEDKVFEIGVYGAIDISSKDYYKFKNNE